MPQTLHVLIFKTILLTAIASSDLDDSGDSLPQMARPDIMCLGNDTAARCFDPWDHRKCIPGSAKKVAITFTFDQYISWPFDSSWYKKMKDAAKLSNADLILLLPDEEAPEDESEKKSCNALSMLVGLCSAGRWEIPESDMMEIEKYFKVVRVPWVVPPGLSKGVPREGGCCGAREFMRLHAIGLEDYDAVVNLATDFKIHGSLTALFDCAASGNFLTARGATSAVNSGMFAIRPSKALLYDLMIEMMSSESNDDDGWNGRGVAPGATSGSAGLQGFLYYYFFQRGAPEEHRITAGQVNPCKWVGSAFCKPGDCLFTPLLHGLKCDESLPPTQRLLG